MVSHEEFERANRRASKMRSDFPLAVKAHYDRRLGRVEVHLNSGLDVAFSPGDVEGLENAKPPQLDKVEISPSGLGLHFPKLGRGHLFAGSPAGIFRIATLDGGASGRRRRQIENRGEGFGFSSERQVGWPAASEARIVKGRGSSGLKNRKDETAVTEKFQNRKNLISGGVGGGDARF